MKCASCHFENSEEAKFCNQCGNKLELACPACGKVNEPGSRFCNQCGHNLTTPSETLPRELSFDEKIAKIQRYLPKGVTEKVLSQRDKIEGERKQVTVMFCDMEAFTSLSDRLGPEEAYTIMDQVYEILIHKVHDYEGTVNEMTGDGIMALFGAPVALEDAPQRAIRSAYAIHRAMTRFSDQIERERGLQPIRMRIGIHTGPVVVGTLGNDLRVEFKAVGDTVNVASRVESLAEPASTYVTEDTFKLTEGLFRFEALGQKQVKGKEEPVGVYRVIAPSTRRTRFDVSAERGLTPFVGRERELELLLDGFQRSKGGRGQAFSIVAEAGVGKSRLLYEFRKAIANEDVTFIEGRCLSYSRNVAYHPVIDTLKSNFDIREGDGDSEIREKVKKSLKAVGVDEASTLPYLLELLSVKDSGIDKIPMSPEARKDRIIEALNRNVLKGSDIRPVVMAIEDLHWIDKSSEDRFKSLLDSISGAKVFLIFTYRPEFVHTWGGRSYHSQVNLNRLSNRESLAMVASLLGTEDIAKDLEELILEKTEGVPFFIEEFVKSLKDLKIIEREDGRFCLARHIRDVAIPSTIQDVVMARVDSLQEGAKEVLQIGCVIGREFDYELIKEVTDLPQQELLSRLSILKDSELLYERGIYPESTYIFKHALTQDAAYQSLLISTRQKYHLKIAQVSEKRFPETAEAHPELLGHHFTEAGVVEQAIPYWQRAGERAIQRSAHVEAINHLSKGLELLTTLAETPERARQELALQISLGAALLATKGYAAPGVGQVYTRARNLCRHVGDISQLLPTLYGLYAFHVIRAEFQIASELGEEFFTLSQRQQHPALLVAHRMRAYPEFFLGKVPQAQEHLEQSICLYDPKQHRSLAFSYGAEPGMAGLSVSALALVLLGAADKAVEMSRHSLAIARETSHPFSLAYALFHAGTIFHQLRGEAQVVQEQAQELIMLCREQGFGFYLAVGYVMCGWAMATQWSQEQRVEGMAQMQQGLAAYQAIGASCWRSYFLALLGEGHAKVGQAKEGVAVLEEALTEAEKTGERFYEAEICRLKGELLLQQDADRSNLRSDPAAEAEFCFRRAIEIARVQQAKLWELRSAMSLGRLWKRQGKRDKAHRLLAETYGWFTEGFDTADLKEAKALLEGLS